MYQDGKFDHNRPEWNALGFMTIGTIMWLMLIYECFYYLYLNSNFPQNFRLIGLIVTMAVFVFYYFLFIYNKQFKKIYDRYKNRNSFQRRVGLAISLSLVFMPMLIAAVITLKWHGKL